MHHIPEGIERFGPVYSTWMYPFERFNSWICQRVRNRAYPEATVMETYRVSFIILELPKMNPGHEHNM